MSLGLEQHGAADRDALLHAAGKLVPRDRLIIRVFDGLRNAGNAILLLAKPIRDDAAKLVKEVDEFNSVIETTDPGQKELARLNNARKDDLARMLGIGLRISSALEKILSSEP
jgi:hypothetical protein